MSYSTASMTDIDGTQELDGVWEHVPNATAVNSVQQSSDTPQPPTQIYGTYAAAVAGDPISVFTDSEQVKDRQNAELNSRISQLEMMIAKLCQQVQNLTDSQASYQSDRSEDNQHVRKRQDTKRTPRKGKPAGPNEDTAFSVTEEGPKETAPTNDNHRTAWDDYSAESTDV